jgi:hypothetical protein
MLLNFAIAKFSNIRKKSNINLGVKIAKLIKIGSKIIIAKKYRVVFP